MSKAGCFCPSCSKVPRRLRRPLRKSAGGFPGNRPIRGKRFPGPVQRDVHDIGKNIVKVLSKTLAIPWWSLGPDVPAQSVLGSGTKQHAKLVGLSALMTTTVPAMERTIALLKREAPDVRVMVGGAVLTQEYADQIGADGYGKDAMAAVRLAERFCASQEGESGAGAK